APAEATERSEAKANSQPTLKTTEVTPMSEEQKQVQTLDASAMTDTIVNGITSGMADIMTKAMQDLADRLAPQAKGGFTVDEALDKLDGTKSFGDWLLNVKRGNVKRLKEIYGSTKDLVEGDGTSGGYLVPDEYLADLVQVSDPFQEVVFPRARKIPGSRRSVSIPVLDQSGTPAAAYKIEYYGGVLSYWTEEAGTKTESQPDFKMLELVAHKLAGYTQASDELLADSALGLDSLLRQLFGGAVRFRRDYAYLRGTGIGQPLGVINSGALLTTARDVANQISSNDIHSLLQIFLPTSMGNAVWVVSQTAMEQIFALSDGAQYNWNQNAVQKPQMMLYGIPIVWSEKVPALGSVGDIMLCDFSYYYIYTRGGLAIDVSQHYAFINDLTTWRFVFRTDGQPSLSDPIYIDTTNQVSPFVALAATTD
ncbi:MAG: phage major capsid protein, partial [Gammaproteobacteria bacterium]